MSREQPPTGPWQDVAIDVLGPLPFGGSLLVVVDYYSRFFEVVIMHSITSQKMIEAPTPIFVRYDYPFSLNSDNAPHVSLSVKCIFIQKVAFNKRAISKLTNITSTY